MNAEDYFELGKRQLANRHYQDAHKNFNEAIKLNLNNLDVFEKRGDALSALRQYGLAIADYQRCLKSKTILYKLGFAYAHSGRHQDAIKSYSLALEQDQDFLAALHERARSYWIWKDLVKAIADYSHIIARDPNDASAFYYRGTIYFAKRDVVAALADFDSAILLKPDFAQALKSRGQLHAQQGRHSAANKDWRNALQHDPSLPITLIPIQNEASNSRAKRARTTEPQSPERNLDILSSTDTVRSPLIPITNQAIADDVLPLDAPLQRMPKEKLGATIPEQVLIVPSSPTSSPYSSPFWQRPAPNGTALTPATPPYDERDLSTHNTTLFGS